jgi:hypothetical protein
MGDSGKTVTPAGGVSLSAQRRQIQELRATIQVLVEMLADAFLLDRELLRERVALRLEQEREESPPMPDPWTPIPVSKRVHVAGDPYREVPRGEPMVTCGACGRVVAERLTVITAEGVICDVCAARKR